MKLYEPLSFRNVYLGVLALFIVLIMIFIPSPGRAVSGVYVQHNLVSNQVAENGNPADPQLVNAWGIAFNPNGVVWVNDNGTGVATLYDGNGVKQSLVVTIPPPAGGMSPSAPTGIIFNTSTDFGIPHNETSTPAVFIFATEDGTISAWAPTVNATNAIRLVDNSGSNAVYKGLALAANGTGHFLYATDFHNNKIDVFNATFQPVTPSGSFSDPNLPSNYAPFGIRNINGDIYVTYAEQGQDAHDDVAGQGHGFVSVFDADGNFIRRFASHGKLNSPWGLAFAPTGFGAFSNMLLIGNFGDGAINAYDIASGKFKGQFKMSNGKVMKIDGLWGLSFGNGVKDQPTDVLFFTAGPNGESDGLYGFIIPQ